VFTAIYKAAKFESFTQQIDVLSAYETQLFTSLEKKQRGV